MSEFVPADTITSPEERVLWVRELEREARLGRETETSLRSRTPSDAASYGQKADWGHLLDQAISRYEQAELAMAYLCGEHDRLDDLSMLDLYCELDIYETLENRAHELENK